MENATRKHRVLVTLAMCVFGAGFILTGTACPPPPPCTSDADCTGGQVCDTATGVCVEEPVGCTSDEDCAEGEVCNTDTGECEPEVTGCMSDDDCEAGEFCDTQTGECETNEALYETVTFDHDFHSGTFDCGSCHHDGAGFSVCSTCHNRDEVVGGIAVLKDAMHDPDGGCWSCHNEQNDDGTRDCSVCHTALPQ